MKSPDMTRKAVQAAIVAAALAAVASCEHKDLCFDHDPHAPKSEASVEAAYEQEWQYDYDGQTDWAGYAEWQQSFGMDYDDLRPSVPGGLRVVTYTTGAVASTDNTGPYGGNVWMRPGEHSLLMYNNDTEYIVFSDIDSFASARATTRTRTRNTYMGSQYADGGKENTVSAPDMLYASYTPSYTLERKPGIGVLHADMRPLVFTYLVRYEFAHGLEYVALARGALAGMAEAVWLNSGRTSEQTATVLYDCTLHTFGAQAKVRSFGVPDFPNSHYQTHAAHRYGLNLEVRLKNGKMKSFDFDVTDQVQAQPQGGVIVVKGISISDAEGTEGGSGFDVSVDGWGDYEDIDLPL